MISSRQNFRTQFRTQLLITGCEMLVLAGLANCEKPRNIAASDTRWHKVSPHQTVS